MSGHVIPGLDEAARVWLPVVLEDEDRDRMAVAEAAALRATLTAIAALGSAYRAMVAAWLRADLARIRPRERHEVLRLAWGCRRRLPRHLVPRVNPDDPLGPDRLRLEAELRQEAP